MCCKQRCNLYVGLHLYSYILHCLVSDQLLATQHNTKTTFLRMSYNGCVRTYTELLQLLLGRALFGQYFLNSKWFWKFIASQSSHINTVLLKYLCWLLDIPEESRAHKSTKFIPFNHGNHHKNDKLLEITIQYQVKINQWQNKLWV